MVESPSGVFPIGKSPCILCMQQYVKTDGRVLVARVPFSNAVVVEQPGLKVVVIDLL